MITQTRVREVLRYDPETGYFAWRVALSNRAQAGSRAGTPHNRGYTHIGIDGRTYLAHRLAWLHMTGAWPADEIDHRNGIRNDNRWSNLREADNRFNNENQRQARRNNNLGVLGVYAHRRRFVARIGHMGARKHLGVFDTPEAAHQAYLEAKRALHAGCTL